MLAVPPREWGLRVPPCVPAGQLVYMWGSLGMVHDSGSGISCRESQAVPAAAPPLWDGAFPEGSILQPLFVRSLAHLAPPHLQISVDARCAPKWLAAERPGRERAEVSLPDSSEILSTFSHAKLPRRYSSNY